MHGSLFPFASESMPSCIASVQYIISPLDQQKSTQLSFIFSVPQTYRVCCIPLSHCDIKYRNKLFRHLSEKPVCQMHASTLSLPREKPVVAIFLLLNQGRKYGECVLVQAIAFALSNPQYGIPFLLALRSRQAESPLESMSTRCKLQFSLSLLWKKLEVRCFLLIMPC